MSIAVNVFFHRHFPITEQVSMTEFAKICALLGDPTLPVYRPRLNPYIGIRSDDARSLICCGCIVWSA